MRAVRCGSLWLRVPADGIGRWTFDRHAIAHRICPTCGIEPFAEDLGDGDGRSACVNVRCLDGIDPAAIQTIAFAGRSL